MPVYASLTVVDFADMRVCVSVYEMFWTKEVYIV